MATLLPSPVPRDVQPFFPKLNLRHTPLHWPEDIMSKSEHILSDPEPSISPLITTTEEVRLQPLHDGFCVVTPNGSVSVPWQIFLEFVCDEASVQHLPTKHPLLLFARLTRDKNKRRRGESFSNASLHDLAEGLDDNPDVDKFGSDPLSPSGPLDSRFPTPTPSENGRSARSRSRTSSVTSLTRSEPIQYNEEREDYIWSVKEDKFWRLESPEGQACAGKVENSLVIFPPGSVAKCKEKDGTWASPAWSPAHGGSNEWIKAQLCGPGCPHHTGFASKRPVLIREHIRRCSSLAANHPLKTLCTLELEAHSRQVWAERKLKRKRESLLEPLSIFGMSRSAPVSPIAPNYSAHSVVSFGEFGQKVTLPIPHSASVCEPYGSHHFIPMNPAFPNALLNDMPFDNYSQLLGST